MAPVKTPTAKTMPIDWSADLTPSFTASVTVDLSGDFSRRTSSTVGVLSKKSGIKILLFNLSIADFPTAAISGSKCDVI